MMVGPASYWYGGALLTVKLDSSSSSSSSGTQHASPPVVVRMSRDVSYQLFLTIYNIDLFWRNLDTDDIVGRRRCCCMVDDTDNA